MCREMAARSDDEEGSLGAGLVVNGAELGFVRVVVVGAGLSWWVFRRGSKKATAAAAG